MHVNAKEMLGHGFPPTQGAKLASKLLSDGADWTVVCIDLSGLPSSMIISGFVNGFLQAVHDADAAMVAVAKTVQWKTRFPFQHEDIATWVRDFKAFEGSQPAT